MKFKTTRKAVKENSGIILEVGYCELQNLLYFKDPAAYTCGVYGWNADESWISAFATPKQYIEVFRAFQKNDWRHNSCGGCI